MANYKEGAKEGLWEAWYNNGQKYIKGYYKTIIRYDPHIGMDKKHSIKDSNRLILISINALPRTEI